MAEELVLLNAERVCLNDELDGQRTRLVWLTDAAGPLTDGLNGVSDTLVCLRDEVVCLTEEVVWLTDEVVCLTDEVDGVAEACVLVR